MNPFIPVHATAGRVCLVLLFKSKGLETGWWSHSKPKSLLPLTTAKWVKLWLLLGFHPWQVSLRLSLSMHNRKYLNFSIRPLKNNKFTSTLSVNLLTSFGNLRRIYITCILQNFNASTDSVFTFQPNCADKMISRKPNQSLHSWRHSFLRSLTINIV